MTAGAVVGATVTVVVVVVLRMPAMAACWLGVGPPAEPHAAGMSPRVKTPSETGTALVHDVCLI